MIDIKKIKTDVINYGAMKVYNTFLVISQDEEDPELFTQKQLNDIFAKKYDIIKVNIDFVVDEENEVVEHECLVFKLGKSSDGTVTYMSNVNNEGSLSSLVLTKENNEVSLEVVEYSFGGDDDKAKIWISNEIKAEDVSFFANMKIGDIIIDRDIPIIANVSNIEIISGELVSCTLVGLYADGAGSPLTLYYSNGSWTEVDAVVPLKSLSTNKSNAGKFLQVQNDGKVAPATISGGTKLYKHTLTFGNYSYKKNGETPAGRGTHTITILNTCSEPYTIAYLNTHFNELMEIQRSIIVNAIVDTNYNDDNTVGTQAQAVCLYIKARQTYANPAVAFETVITGQKSSNGAMFNGETITDRYSGLVLTNDTVTEL